MIKGTFVETLLREAVAICIEEYKNITLNESKKKVGELELQKPRYVQVKDWQKLHGYPSVGGLRHLINYSKTNGFEQCIRRIGRRVLIDEEEYFKWVKGEKRTD